MGQFFQRLPEFVGNHLLLSLLFVLLLVAVLVNEALRSTRKYKQLTPGTLTHLINREDALVVDLSSHADYQKAHIPGAKHIVASQFGPEQADVAKLQGRPIVVVCKDGRASSKAVQQLVKSGIEKAYTLGGGMLSWQQADLPVAKGNK